MPLFRGSQEIKKLYRGSTEIKKMYRGSVLIFDSAGSSVEDPLNGLTSFLTVYPASYVTNSTLSLDSYDQLTGWISGFSGDLSSYQDDVNPAIMPYNSNSDSLKLFFLTTGQVKLSYAVGSTEMWSYTTTDTIDKIPTEVVFSIDMSNQVGAIWVDGVRMDGGNFIIDY